MIDDIQERIESVDHWELLTLMVLTFTAIITLYTIGLLFVRPVFAHVDFHLFLTAGFVIAMGIAGIQYWQSMHQMRQRGDELTRNDVPELHDAAQQIADEMGIKKPELRVIDNETPNAFATGRRSDGIVFFHSGLLETLPQEEIEAILAHELAHLQKCDAPVMQLANAVRRLMMRGAWIAGIIFVTVAAAIVSDENETKRQVRRRQRRQQRLVAVITTFVSGLVLLFSRSLSRYREYVADLTAAKAIDDPQQMSNALQSLDTMTQGGHEVSNTDTPSLYIVNDVQGRLARLFETHPSMEKRIDVLESEFETETATPSPTDVGPVLGRFTKFGLVAAPMVLLAIGLGTIILAITEYLIGGVMASLEGSGPIGAIILLVVFLAWIASLTSFPWAMLFADGGSPVLGFASVVFVILFLFGSVILPDVLLLKNINDLAYIGLMAVAAVQTKRVINEVQSAY